VTGGVNFAIYSQSATEVFLLFFDKEDGTPTDIIQLQNRSKFIWHTFVPGVTAGQLYAFKGGDYNPSRGLRSDGAQVISR
jgi:isoamylase